MAEWGTPKVDLWIINLKLWMCISHTAMKFKVIVQKSYHSPKIAEIKHRETAFPCSEVKSLSHVWLWDPMDCSLPGSSVHGILQARILEWVAISCLGYLLNPGIKPRSPTLEADALTSNPPVSPKSLWALIPGSLISRCLE